MATLLKEAYDATIIKVIDTIVSTNPTKLVEVLKNNGFQDSFPYGNNPATAEKILILLYHNNTPLFWKIVKQVPLDRSKVIPADRTDYDSLISSSSVPTQKTDWWQTVLSSLEGTTVTEGQGTPQQTYTSAGAYIVYTIIIIAIIGIVIYMLRMKNI